MDFHRLAVPRFSFLCVFTMLVAPALGVEMLSSSRASAATVEAHIPASTDDAEESSTGSVNLTSSDLELVMDSKLQTVGMRWTGFAIPPGATITSAYIQFTAKESQTEATSLLIRGEAADNAAAFVAASRNVSSRLFTTASRAWTPVAWTVGSTGAAQRTPDLSAVLQEIVHRPGWASGNALALVITGTGHRTATSFDGTAANAPLLHVEFTTAPPPENPPLAILAVRQTTPKTVSADASASTDMDLTPIATYQFDFGDGSPALNTSAPIATATHTYESPGDYVVTLIVTDTGGNPSSPVTALAEVTESVSETLEKRVTMGMDDAEESAGGSVGLTSSDLDFVRSSSGTQTIGMRWTGVTIPPGATITLAYVQLVASSANTEATSLVFQGQAADNPATFAATSRNISTRPRTAASRSWTPPAWAAGSAAPDQRTPDLSAVIQEIVDLPGWVSGNAIALIVSGSGLRSAESYEGSPSQSPLLHVECLVGPPPPDDPPVARLSAAQASSPPLTVRADASASTDTDRTPIAGYRFDFGDATVPVTSTTPIVTHQYPDVGTYTVSLVAIDSGDNVSETARADVVVTPPPDDPPNAHLSVTQLASPPLTVRADASASVDEDVTPIAGYQFDFGDGTPPVISAAPEAVTTHTYASAGVYGVTLLVTDTGSRVSAPAASTVTVVAGYPGSVEKRPLVSSDDAEESASGSANLTSSDLELVQESTTQTVGIRWSGLAIPNGARITNAYVQFTAKESRSEATTLLIRGQAIDNALAFTTSSGNVSSRARTSVSQGWSPAAWTAGSVGAGQRTPDLSAVIQEIVNRPGWTTTSALALIITGSGCRNATSFDGSATDAALLHVDYLSDRPPQDDPPAARLSVAPAPSPPLTVIADASASTDVDATPIASYRFDFGDGTPPVASTNPIVTHTYESARTWTISLQVTDTGSQTSTPVTANFIASTGAPAQIAVHTGYYDTHHPGLTKPKPNPWKGSPNVVFVGKADPGTTNEWDSSALRIDNLGSEPLSGVVVTANIGSKSYALWGTQSIGVGQTLILAQTAFENFDGSDTNPAGCYGCSSRLCVTSVSSTRPVVHVTIGGVTTDYLDSGQILNTHGVDAAGCPATGTRNDESEAWQRIYPSAVASGMPALVAPEHEAAAIAPVLSLAPVAPNPSRGEIGFHFSIPRAGMVRLAVYDVTGRIVMRYMNEELEAGDYRGHVVLTGMHPGVYYLGLWTPERRLDRRFVLIQ